MAETLQFDLVSPERRLASVEARRRSARSLRRRGPTGRCHGTGARRPAPAGAHSDHNGLMRSVNGASKSGRFMLY